MINADMENSEEVLKSVRAAYTVQGRVQGVGFRPFIWRLAKELNLSGFVKNSSAGVRIEAQGETAALLEFESRILSELPPLARITALKRDDLIPVLDETSFEILASTSHSGQNVLVSPDIGICEDCLKDMRDPHNYRYAYPFTNCVNCGPRYTITTKIPYDRSSTVMACFPLCVKCASEYSDPANRRFHAQPIACPDCGPRIWHVAKEELNKKQTNATCENQKKALEKAGVDLLAGKIVALKGLGGFQLACDAKNSQAIALLRERKKRPHKALAVMARDLDSVLSFCSPDSNQIQLLQSPEKPIVLCPKNITNSLPQLIAPDLPHVGVMLPYTPLHALLFDWLHEHGLPNPVLVMTSANPAGEPICLGNREALQRLEAYADSWLLHDRDILVRVDDSVAAINPANENKTLMLRRARGFVPVPQKLPFQNRQSPILGSGADLKAAFCLIRGSEAFMSQHIGDLENAATLGFYEEALQHLQNLLECKPEFIVHDVHPNFHSSILGRGLAEKLQIPHIALQHHAAHAASVLAENQHYAPALALCLDGSGLGTDQSIWGGELLYMDLGRPFWERVGSFTPFPLPGGEQAIKEPWRIAFALDFQTGKLDENSLDITGKRLWEMLKRNLNSPQCSSCGRLFDAMAAKLGLCAQISYEGQAAMRLMNSAWSHAKKLPSKNTPKQLFLRKGKDMPKIDSVALFSFCAKIFAECGNAAEAAAHFHHALADSLAELCCQQAKKYAVRHIGLSGGVLQNFLLASLLNEKLQNVGLLPLWHQELPCGDGGLAFGQAVWGRQLLNSNASKIFS